MMIWVHCSALRLWSHERPSRELACGTNFEGDGESMSGCHFPHGIAYAARAIAREPSLYDLSLSPDFQWSRVGRSAPMNETASSRLMPVASTR